MTKRDPHERRVRVLHAVVERYLATRQPVGSAAVCHELSIKASPATIRNDMAELEDAGYLEQPHTSAGRVPTVRAYRLLVDRIVSVMPLSTPQRQAIASFLSDQPSIEDTLRMAAHLLARITGQIAMVSSPSFTHATVRRFEIVPMSSTVFLLIVISSTGRVEQRTIVFSHALSDQQISSLTDQINRTAVGQSVSNLSPSCMRIAHTYEGTVLADFCTLIAHALSGLDDAVRSDALYLAGTARLTHSSTVSRQELSNLLDALEEQVVMMQLLSSVSRSATKTGVGVAIGEETHLRSLLHSSVVSSPYLTVAQSTQSVQPVQSVQSAQSSQSAQSTQSTGQQSAGTTEGKQGNEGTASGETAQTQPEAYVGSIGPTHIDYPSTMAVVKAVATYLSTIIGHQDVGHQEV